MKDRFFQWINSAGDLWRCPVFRRELGLTGTFMPRLWRHPLLRTLFISLAMLIVVPLVSAMFYNSRSYQREFALLALTGGYLLAAAFIPAIAMNRRLVKLIKTGQMEHLYLSLIKPAEWMKAFIWSNMLKFWPLIPAGVLGIAAALASSNQFSRHDWDDLLLVVYIAVVCTTCLVLVNAMFSFWVTLRFYRTRITLLFLLIGIVVLDVAVFYVIAGFIAIVVENFDKLWSITVAGFSLMVWMLLWGHARAYLDGNFIEEMLGGRDVPHHPYGVTDRMPWLWSRCYLRNSRFISTAIWLIGSAVCGWLIYMMMLKMAGGMDSMAMRRIAIPAGSMAGWLIMMGWAAHRSWSRTEPHAGQNTLTPMTLTQMAIVPVILALLLFGVWYFWQVFVPYSRANMRYMYNEFDLDMRLAMGGALHLIFFLFLFNWLAARKWRRGHGLKGFAWKAFMVVLLIEGVFWVAGWIVYYAFASRYYHFGYNTDIFEDWLGVWVVVSVMIMPWAIGLMFLGMLRIVRANGGHFVDDTNNVSQTADTNLQ